MKYSYLAMIWMTALVGFPAYSLQVKYVPRPDDTYVGYTARLIGSWRPVIIDSYKKDAKSTLKAAIIAGTFNSSPTFIDAQGDHLTINCSIVVDNSIISGIQELGHRKQKNPRFQIVAKSIGGYECRIAVARNLPIGDHIQNYEQFFLWQKLRSQQGYAVVVGGVDYRRLVTTVQLTCIERILSSVKVTPPGSTAPNYVPKRTQGK